MKRQPLGWLCFLGALMPACGAGPYLNYEEYYTTMGVETYLGGGCVASEEGLQGESGGGVAGGANDAMQAYSVRFLGRSVGLTVIVSDGNGHALAQRDYSNDFLDAGKTDELVAPLGDDFVRLHIQGGSECRQPRDPSAS